jgi:hypothetical protein
VLERFTLHDYDTTNDPLNGSHCVSRADAPLSLHEVAVGSVISSSLFPRSPDAVLDFKSTDSFRSDDSPYHFRQIALHRSRIRFDG